MSGTVKGPVNKIQAETKFAKIKKNTKNEVTVPKSALEAENMLVDTVENKIHNIKTASKVLQIEKDRDEKKTKDEKRVENRNHI